MCVGESADAEAVGAIQLALEELAAHVLDLLQLQQARRREKRLHQHTLTFKLICYIELFKYSVAFSGNFFEVSK